MSVDDLNGKCDSREFAAAVNFAAYFPAANAEFCSFCPKAADFDAAAVKGAGIYGKIPDNRFQQCDLEYLPQLTTRIFAGKQQRIPILAGADAYFPGAQAAHFLAAH